MEEVNSNGKHSCWNAACPALPGNGVIRRQAAMETSKKKKKVRLASVKFLFTVCVLASHLKRYSRWNKQRCIQYTEVSFEQLGS